MSKWYFTFGFDHVLADGRVQLDENWTKRGLVLASRYVVVLAADEMAARRVFIEVMGNRWASVYDAVRGPKIVARYGMTELELLPGGLR